MKVPLHHYENFGWDMTERERNEIRNQREKRTNNQSMDKHGTIQAIVHCNSSWTTGNGKTMYEYDVTIETADGARITGVASSTSAEAPPYQVGDDVVYVEKPSHHGLKLKITKQRMDGQPSNFGRQASAKQDHIAVQWAIGRGIEVALSKKASGSDIDMLGYVKTLAEEFLQMRNDILQSK